MNLIELPAGARTVNGAVYFPTASILKSAGNLFAFDLIGLI